MAHTDIAAGGWVGRLPPAIRPYVLLARLDRPIGIWLLVLPGVWGLLLARAPWPATLRLLALFAVGAVAMRAAGCVVNDLWDRDIDRRVARTAARPLAAGTLRPRQALVFLVLLLAAALAVLLQLNATTQRLGVASLVLVALYPLAKRVTWWPQLVMGLPFGFGAPMGYVAVTGRIDAPCLLLYAAAILWDVGFDTIYGFQDIADDAIVGVRSTSRRFERHAHAFIATCYAGEVACLAAALLLAHTDPVLLAVPALLLAHQVRSLDIASPARCLALFRANRTVGLAVAAAILAGDIIAGLHR